MRISTGQLHQNAVDALLDQQSKISRTQMQLSTGRRIVTPVDDPAGAVSALDLGQVIATTSQYQRNAGLAQGRLEAEETALAGAVDLLQRARELAVRGNNDTLAAGERTAIASEVRELLDQLLGLANTRDANGEYLFAGFQTDTQPFSQSGNSFSFNGDQGQRYLQIGPSRQVAVGDSGFDVFMNVPGTSRDAFSVLLDLATDLEADNPDPANIDEIDAVMENILNVRAGIGARLNSIEMQRDGNEARILQFQKIKSEIEDLDYAEAVARLQMQLTGLQAAMQSYQKVQGLTLFSFL